LKNKSKNLIENGNVQIPKLVGGVIDAKLMTHSNDTVNQVNQRVMAIEAIVANIASRSSSVTQSSFIGDKSKKVLLEYAAVNTMRVVGSEGVEFKEWGERSSYIG
jgi:hypothetical protein